MMRVTAGTVLRNLCTILAGILFHCAFAQVEAGAPIGCEDFRTGTFTYKEAPFDQVVVNRRKKIQTEYDPRQNLRMKFAIRWTAACEYELTYLKVNDADYANLIGTKLKVRITEFPDGRSCRYICTGFDGQRSSFTIIKLK